MKARKWPLPLIREVQMKSKVVNKSAMQGDLWEASRRGDITRLEYLLNTENVDPNEVDRVSSCSRRLQFSLNKRHALIEPQHRSYLGMYLRTSPSSIYVVETSPHRGQC